MASKLETINQYEGFGNRRQKRQGEHYRSTGFTFSALGMTASRRVKSWFSDPADTTPQITSLGSVLHWAQGVGFPLISSGGDESMMFSLDSEGHIYQSQDSTSTPQIAHPYLNSSHFGSGALGGLIVDPKNRLLYPGRRYLGRFDPTVSEDTITITVTNGSDDVVRTAGASFSAGTHEECYLKIIHNSEVYFYRIDNVVDANNADLYSTITEIPSGSYSATIMKGWIDQWKDFGANLDSLTSDGFDRYIPTETYEDTVLFGRKNVITTLSTVTDTVTTDAAPAFDMPTGYDVLAIHKGSNGILMGFNHQRKGVLVLWDNYSDRAIAPWIVLPDRLISLCKYTGGWIAITARGFYYTNGYTIENLAESMLDMDISPLAANTVPQTSLVIEKDLYFLADFSLNGRRRAGLHKMDLKTRLIEYIPLESMSQKEKEIYSIFYGSEANRIYSGQTASMGYMEENTAPSVSTFITNGVGEGGNVKFAETVKLDLGISQDYYTQDSPFSATVVVKVCPLERQTINYGQVKTLQTAADQIVVNETTFGAAEVGDEIEFLMGNNAGYSRNITAKSGTGDTVTYTLDRDLPGLSAANDYFFRSHFKPVRVKAFTNITEFSPDLLLFEVKNRYKGKKFLIKIDIEDATVPIEMRPIQFIYDDNGAV